MGSGHFSHSFKKIFMRKNATLLSLFLLPFAFNASAQKISDTLNKITVKGKIIDSNGKAVPFASLIIKNTLTGVLADSLGQFEISLPAKSILIIGSTGYQPIEIDVADKTSLVAILTQKLEALQNISVHSKTENTAARQSTLTEQQNMAAALADYKSGSNITNSPGLFNTIKNGSEGIPSISSTFGYNPGSGKIYTGAAIPVFMPKDQTKGRQYLFDKWVPGEVTNDKGVKVVNEKYLFNYNKMGKVLLFTEDQKSVFELDVKTINSFTLLYNSEQWYYQKINFSGKDEFVRALTQTNTNYTLYGSTSTKFVKANYVSTGLTESGNNYDEFLDSYKYMIFSQKDRKIVPIELKTKFIKSVFDHEKLKLDKWLSQNAGYEINEEYLIRLVDYLNKE